MTDQRASSMPNGQRPARWALAILGAMILAYSVYFSIVSIRLHQAQRTHMADLGQIDLAIWNTGQGRFVQEVKNDEISTRLTDHVEPIFAPVSLVFRAWDDVRALLVLQSVLLALGAVPVFMIAHGRLGGRAAAQRPTHRRQNGNDAAALAFAFAYLLYPPLQAANVAEFHALTLAAPAILLAFWAIEGRQWVLFAVAALVVASVQEGTALLAAALGLYALACGLWEASQSRKQASGQGQTKSGPAPFYRGPILAGILVLVAGLAWFYVATFVVIPAYAAQAYGLDETPYVDRFGALGDSFGQVLAAMLTRPGAVLQVALEPLRVRYLIGLLAPMGFLSVAGIEVLALGLPLLLANLLSAFPFQYSGQLHYSAPLAAYVVMAAIVGSQRLRLVARRVAVTLRARSAVRMLRSRLLLVAWLLAWSLGSQLLAGYSPIGARFRFYWPQVTAHHELLERFLAQIPPEAPVSTMPTLYPHLSHREHIYQFPVLGDSQYVLLDLAAQTGWARHPAVIRDTVEEMLASGAWDVADASDGYLLMVKADNPAHPSTVSQLPEEFLTFAQPDSTPQHPLEVTFAPPGRSEPHLKLIGYDLIDDPQWRMTGLRLYWQAIEQLPDNVRLRGFFVNPHGQEVDSTDERPLIQPLWYPPSTWNPGEVVITDKLRWFLPKEWAPAVGVYQGETWDDIGARWRIVEAEQEIPIFQDQTWALLGHWERVGDDLQPGTLPRVEDADQSFAGDGWTVALTGVSPLDRTAPGQRAPLVLRWQADGPAPRDYTIFVHVRDEKDRNVAQGDAAPTWFGLQPTSRWTNGQEVLSAHSIELPADLSPGVYDVVVGWYYWETQERLGLVDHEGQPIGDGAVIARLEIDSSAASQPDLCCALSPECCASQ